MGDNIALYKNNILLHKDNESIINGNEDSKNSNISILPNSALLIPNSVLLENLSEGEIVERVRLSAVIVMNLWHKHYHNYINSPYDSDLQHFWWMRRNLSIRDLMGSIDLVPTVYLSNNVPEIARFVRRVFLGYRDTLIEYNKGIITNCEEYLALYSKRDGKRFTDYSNDYIDYVFDEKKRAEGAIVSLERWVIS